MEISRQQLGRLKVLLIPNNSWINAKLFIRGALKVGISSSREGSSKLKN